MLLSALMIGFCTAYASASTPVWLLRAKAGIAAALMAANIVFEPIGALEQQALGNAIDPFNLVQTVSDTAWTDYIDQSVITVRPDVVTIDGVPYSEIWLGQDAANSLRASGFDFTTAYNILANQSTPISYADGAGLMDDGTPIYNIDGALRTPEYMIGNNGSVDLMNGTFTLSTPARANLYYTGLGQTNVLVRNNYPSNLPYYVQARVSRDGSYRVWSANKSKSYSQTDIVAGTGHADMTPFTFDYTSGIIETEPVDDGLLLRVPSSYTDSDPTSIYNYDIHDFIVNYPQADDSQGHELIFDPSLNPDFDVDLDMGNALGDLITAVILAKLADLLGDHSDVIYAPFPDKPEPGPEPGVIDPLPDPDPAPEDPVPGTTIADTDWIKLDEILRWIQSTIDSIRHLTESLQTMLDSIFDAIQSVIQQIAEIPEAIRELADKILEDIELGPSKLFDKALDILKTLFLPLLLPIRAMMNLWHYVVEWIGSITTPFTWVFGIMSGTSGNMVLPIYSLLAGGICISIYKALGR